MTEPPEINAEPTLTIMSELMTPNDANFLGKVFGGKLLSVIDLCAYATAARYSGEVCVTASFDRVDFLEPIEVGELVSLHGVVSYVGRTSIEVTIEVYAENPVKQNRRHTNTARVTMVAIRDGVPVPVPKLQLTTRESKIRFLEGKLRREMRSAHRAERERIAETYRKLSDSQLDELLAPVA